VEVFLKESTERKLWEGKKKVRGVGRNLGGQCVQAWRTYESNPPIARWCDGSNEFSWWIQMSLSTSLSLSGPTHSLWADVSAAKTWTNLTPWTREPPVIIKRSEPLGVTCGRGVDYPIDDSRGGGTYTRLPRLEVKESSLWKLSLLWFLQGKIIFGIFYLALQVIGMQDNILHTHNL